MKRALASSAACSDPASFSISQGAKPSTGAPSASPTSNPSIDPRARASSDSFTARDAILSSSNQNRYL